MVGEFEIVERLGAGGMGEVYRARDARLGRDVAIKILPETVAAEPGRLERLTREARLLASLNHPNIAAIYAVETAAPVHALVLELVEGETLGARIRRKPLSIVEARAVARQIVGALDAAHECGIVHRDLKPENVMLGPRGIVKVLDFGVAKTASHVAAVDMATVSLTPTAEGIVVGTAAYMSPEQARGQRVDRRADIWAFGCVLYEMLTGRRAFAAATLSDTLVATLEREPSWDALPRDTPPGIRRLLERTLQKDPHDRLRDIADAVPYLDDEITPSDAAALRPAIAWIPWAVAGVVALAAAWLWLASGGSSPSDPIARSVLVPLTRDAGFTTDPTVSKDGRLLAYASDRAGGGTLDIWVQQVAGGTPIRLTDDEADDVAPDFSPDGSQILFQSDRGGGGAYLVSAFGGAPPRLVARGARQPRFSPDGTRIAYWSGAWRGDAAETQTEIFVVSLAGGEPRRLAPDFRAARAPVWAPDGRSLLFLGRAGGNAPVEESFDWWWTKLDGSAPVKVGLLADASLRGAEPEPSAWTADEVLFSDSTDLWSVAISQATGRMQGPPRRLTVSAGASEHPAVGADGRIVFASTQSQRVIERAPLDASDRPQPPVQLYADFAPNTGRPSETRDGSVLVFERVASNGIEIWTRNIRTRVEQNIARVESPQGLSSTISPDGTRIAYTAGGYGFVGNGFVVETARGVPFQVCDHCIVAGFLSDSRRLLLWSRDAIRVHDVTSGTSLDVVTSSAGGLSRPHASPDDRWLAFRSSAGPDGAGKSFVVPLTPGHPPRREEWQAIQEPTTSGRPGGWSTDSRMVYLLLDTDGFRCLWGQRVNAPGRLDGVPVPVRHFHGVDWAEMSTSFGNAVSADGFMYATMRSRGNIWSLVRR